MRFRIKDRTYTTAAIGRLSLRQLMQVENETEALGRRMRWDELQGIAQRIGEMPVKDAGEDPEYLWFVALVIWSSRVDAGEQISFLDAIDFPIDDLEWLPEPKDHQQPANPTKARPGSGRAGSGGAGGRKGKKKTSGKR